MKTAKEVQIGAKRVHAPLKAVAESSASTPRPLPEFATLNWRETTVLLDFDHCSIGTQTRKENIMANVSTKTPTAAPSPKARPGRTLGQAQEFTLISRLKPGGAKRMRELFREGFDAERKAHTDRIGTVHDLRFVIFDNDSRVIFASTF